MKIKYQHAAASLIFLAVLSPQAMADSGCNNTLVEIVNQANMTIRVILEAEEGTIQDCGTKCDHQVSSGVTYQKRMYADTKISEDATGSIRIEVNDTQTSNLGATAEYKFVNPAGGSDLCNNKSSGSLDNSNSTVVLTESTGRTSDGKDFYRLTVKHR